MPLDSAATPFSPAARRGSKWPSLALALALHLALGLLAFWGWRSQSIKIEDDTAPAQVGLWTAADIAHAAKVPEPIARPPKPKAQRPVPAEPEEAADIHLGQKKPNKKHPPTPAPTAKPTAKPTEKPKTQPSPAPTHKPTPDPRVAQEKQRQAQAKAEKLAQDKARQDALKRMLGEAKNAGQAGGSTTSAHNGQGKSAYKPSKEYEARVAARIKQYTNFDASNITGNPSVEIEMRLSANGEVLGRPMVLRPSGNSTWDAAAVVGIQRASPFPIDPKWDGKAPPPMVIIRTPIDSF